MNFFARFFLKTLPKSCKEWSFHAIVKISKMIAVQRENIYQFKIVSISKYFPLGGEVLLFVSKTID